jgi:lysophospholipase L1-like esterase
MTRTFERYIALGDSISIDYYPALDFAGKRDGYRPCDLRFDLGAASLFFRNADDVHPEFRGRDLSSLVPAIRFRKADPLGIADTDNLTADGATTDDVLDTIAQLERSADRILITLTIGGNDLLAAAQIRGMSRDGDPVRGTAARLKQILDGLFSRCQNAEVIVGTVYDPTDGTFMLPLPGGGIADLRPAAAWLNGYNEAIRQLVTSDPRLHLADIYEHFKGHGTSARRKANRWYWSQSIIEPNVRGASEVRRLWLESLKGIIGKKEGLA